MAAAAAEPLISEKSIGDIPSQFDSIYSQIQNAVMYYKHLKEKNYESFKDSAKYLQNVLTSKTTPGLIEHFAIQYLNNDKVKLISFMSLLKTPRHQAKYIALVKLINDIGLLNYYEGGRRRYRKHTKRSHTRRHKKTRKQRHRA